MAELAKLGQTSKKPTPLVSKHSEVIFAKDGAVKPRLSHGLFRYPIGDHRTTSAKARW